MKVVPIGRIRAVGERVLPASSSGPRPASHDAEVFRVFEATMRGRADEARNVYLSLLHGTSRTAFRARLKTFLEAHDMGALEIIYEEGKAEGLAQGEARALLAILRKRGLLVLPAVEKRVRGTADIATLERWIERAVEVATIDDVFAA